MKDVFNEIKSLVNEVNFKNRPLHVSYKYRTIYQVSRLVLVIGMTSSKWGCSILKIQVLSSVLDNEKLFKHLELLVNNGGDGFIRGWKYSKLISTAINYSNAEKITKLTATGKVVLTERGKCFFDEIMEDNDLLFFEKYQLKKLKKKLSDAKLMTIIERG